MLNVLFVDDDAFILMALKRTLRTYRDQWRTDFVDTPAAALQCLETGAYDVVVSDMRMPGMDGAQLLSEVSRLRPETIRIILSGQSSEESILRTVGPAHQFLSKPCSPELLKETVDRACAVRTALNDPGLRSLVARIDSLPSLPTVFERILREIASPQSSVERIGQIIGQDVAMTAKILHLVNSSFFGLAHHVTSPAHAASLLGLGLIKSLVLAAGVFRHFESGASKCLQLESLVAHSLLVGRLSGLVATHEAGPSHVVDDCMVAGMLHDIGKLIFAAEMPQQYAEMQRASQENLLTTIDLEQRHLGASHGPVGGYLLGLWGLPNSVVEAVTFHHQPAKGLAGGFCPLAAVHVADCWVRNHRPGQAATVETIGCDLDFLQRIGMKERAAGWLRLFADFAPDAAKIP